MKSVPPEAEASQALRELFAAQARKVPVVDDLSGVALLRAKRIARRRASIGGLAVTVAFALGLGGVVSWQHWTTPETGQDAPGISGVAGGKVEFDADAAQAPVTSGTAPLQVDLVVGDRLYDATAGKWRPLPSGNDEVSIVRTQLGWLVGYATSLHLLRTDGTDVPLLDELDGWTVSADGSEVAAVRGTTLLLNRLTRDGLQQVTSSEVPAGHVPIGFLATSVLMATPDRSRFGVWQRDGSFREADGLSQIYGSFQADSFAVVPGSSGRPCLIRVSVGGGQFHRDGAAGCHEVLEQGMDRAAVSPNGQDLATPFDGGLWIINLARSVAEAGANGAANPVWVAACASDPDASPVWQDDATVVTRSRGSLLACGVDGSQRAVQLPAGVPESGRLVPIRG
jgi:hypothetical protein